MKRIIMVVACFIVLIVLLYGIFSLTLFETSAKYTDYKELNHYFESKELYISSNSLSEKQNKYNIINYYDYNIIPLEVTNSINDNQITNYDIEYTLECNILDNEDSHLECIIDDTESNINNYTLESIKQCIEDNSLNEEECISKEYNYNLVKSTNKHTFKILNNNSNKKNIQVELILNTISPYSKTLKSIYILNIGNDNNNNISISEVKDYNSFCEYSIINNYYSSKNIKLTIDTNKLLFDNNSKIFSNIINYTTNNDFINTITFELSNNKIIKLYKKDFNYECNINDIEYIIEN